LQETKIPAANQVLEQIVRMIVIYFIAAAFVPRGLEYAAAAALIAIVVEEIFSFLFVFVAYKIYKKNSCEKKFSRAEGATNVEGLSQQNNRRHENFLTTSCEKKFSREKKFFSREEKKFLPTISRAQSFALIMAMALPLTGNRVAGSLLTAWENVLIPRRLQMFGLPAAEAISEFGRIQGMAIPLIFFPTAVLTALSVTLVPAVSEATAAKDLRGVSAFSSKALLFASVTGMGAAALFLFFSHELGIAIYNQQIGFMLQLLGVMCPFIYMQIIISGVLNGLGCQMFIFRNSLISSGICIAFIFLLVPKFGLAAYIFGWLVSLVVVIALGLRRIRNFMPLETEFSKWFLRPLIAAAAAGMVSRLLAEKFFFELAGLKIGLVFSIATLGAIYFFGVIFSGCISREEIFRLFRKR